MVKKRLVDMLREESQKLTDSEGETIEAKADEIIEQDTIAVEELASARDESSREENPSLTYSDLEKTVKELVGALQEAQEKNVSLQEQIDELQSKLQEQKKLVKKLNAEVKQTEQIKEELEEAKKAALQLAKANEKLTQNGNAPKPPQDSRKTSQYPLPRFHRPSGEEKSVTYNLGKEDLGWFD